MNDINNIRGFSRAAENLSLILKNTLDIIIEPAKMKAISKAEMKIEKERLFHKYELEKMDLFNRAEIRRLSTEIRRQYNLEKICRETMKMLSENATPEKINIDWLHHFASSAQDVSENDLRKLWTFILSQEAMQPGKYSKRTLNYLKSFNVKDCRAFEKLVPFLFEEKETTFFIIPSNDRQLFTEKYGFEYTEFVHLSTIGIIASLVSSELSINSKERSELLYLNRKLLIYNPTNKEVTIRNVYILSEVGSQIKNLINVKINEQYFKEVIEKMEKMKLEIQIV